ncbi:hypothetical protein ABZP36_000057 [Zizania latifolia]
MSSSSVPEIKPSIFITLSVNNSDGVRVTRTMRTTDKLRDLTSFYLAMVSAYGRGAGEGIFMHYGRIVSGERSPPDYDMKDGDEITFFMTSKRSEFVTLKIKGEHGCIFTRTMGLNDRMQDLTEFYYAMVPTAKYGRFMYNDMEVDGELSPSDYAMEDYDEITFFPNSKQSLFVTLKIKGAEDGRSFTRTMDRTGRLQDLVDFYNAMVPMAENGVFMYNGRRVIVLKSPSDYKMEDGDQLIRRQRDMFVTISVECMDIFRHTHTLRRTDKLQGLMVLCSSMVTKCGRGCSFIFKGRLVHGTQTPGDLELQDGDKISMFVLVCG